MIRNDEGWAKYPATATIIFSAMIYKTIARIVMVSRTPVTTIRATVSNVYAAYIYSVLWFTVGYLRSVNRL